MKYVKRTIFLLFLWGALFFNITKAKAVFDLEMNMATYDSNNGLLIIYHSDFNKSYSEKYLAHLSKIKLGDVSIQGTYQFHEGMLKIYIRNKDVVNQQSGFQQTNILSKKLSLEKGAIIKSYTPPGGINVVIDSPSNEVLFDVNVTGLKPKISIDKMKANISTLASTGGNVVFTVSGENLQTANFKINNINSNTTYHLTGTSTMLTAVVPVLPNSLTTSRKDTYVLYMNDVETNKMIEITVLEHKKEENNNSGNDSSNTNKPPVNDNSNDDKNEENESPIITNPDEKEENNGNTNDENSDANLKDQNETSAEDKEPVINQENHEPDLKKENSSYFIILIISVILLALCGFLYYKFKYLKIRK